MNELITNYEKQLDITVATLNSYEEQIANYKSKCRKLTKRRNTLDKHNYLSPIPIQQIKKYIQSTSDLEDIRNYILTTFENIRIKKLIALKKDISIILEDQEAQECKICFENKIQSKSKCKTCKVCYICEGCECDQIKKYNRCAFCNTNYT